MKNIFLCILFCTVFSCACFADDSEAAEKFFKKYTDAANNYDMCYFNFYADNAKIIRVVEKPDGTTQSVTIPLSKYKSEAKRSVKLAKLRKYKNRYLNIKVSEFGNDYKISALRMPSTSNYKIPAYFIVGKNECGEWKIKEESMNTRVQSFLAGG